MGKLIALVGVIIAACAAYFSIYGLAHIYVSAFVSVIIMGSVLEVGKLVTASFLYRYWDHTKLWLRTYLIIAMVVLMAITSFGTYSYLSNAYQLEEVDVTNITSRVELLSTEMSALQERRQEITDDISRIGDNYITKRMELIDKYRPERQEIDKRIAEIRSEKLTLQQEQSTAETETGLFKIKNIARVLGMDPNDVLVWLTLLLVIVFDPLAVALTVAANIVSEQNKKQKKKGEESSTDDEDPDPSPPPVKKATAKTDNGHEPTNELVADVTSYPVAPSPPNFRASNVEVDVEYTPPAADLLYDQEEREIVPLIDTCEQPLSHSVGEDGEEGNISVEPSTSLEPSGNESTEDSCEDDSDGDGDGTNLNQSSTVPERRWQKEKHSIAAKRKAKELSHEPSPGIQSEQDLDKLIQIRRQGLPVDPVDRNQLHHYADKLSKPQ